MLKFYSETYRFLHTETHHSKSAQTIWSFGPTELRVTVLEDRTALYSQTHIVCVSAPFLSVLVLCWLSRETAQMVLYEFTEHSYERHTNQPTLCIYYICSHCTFYISTYTQQTRVRWRVRVHVKLAGSLLIASMRFTGMTLVRCRDSTS